MPDPSAYPSLLALTDVMATGWHAAVAAGVREGGSVVVVGDGAVGLCGVLAASVMGAETIIAMSPARAAAADRHRVRRHPRGRRARQRGRRARCMEITDGIGADAVLECVGTDAAMGTAFAVAGPGSTVGFVGVPHGVELPVAGCSRRTSGWPAGWRRCAATCPSCSSCVTSGRIDPGRVFDSALPLDEVAEGYRAMDERRAIKVQINP